MKSVGVNVEDQAGWLLYHLKRLYPNGKHLEVIMEDYEQLRDFSSVSPYLRRDYTRSQYKIFQMALKKFSGSSSMDTHRQFLKAQYSAMHQRKAEFHPLDEKSWKKVLRLIEELSVGSKIPYSTLTPTQKHQRKPRHEALEMLIEVTAGSTCLKEQEGMLNDRLNKVHRNFKPYGWKRLANLIDKLELLEPFTNDEE